MAIKYKKAGWIDILNPKQKDLLELQKKFSIHPATLEELKEPSARSHVEVFKDYLYFVYYFPTYDPLEETSWRTEVDFVITKNAVVTVHYDDIEALKGVQLGDSESPIRLAHHIMMAFMRFQERQLRHIREKTEAVGQELFKDREKEALRRISHLKRDVSEYRIIVRHQAPILHSLLEKMGPFGSEEDKPYLENLAGDHLKIVNQLDDYRQAITDFEDTNNQLMNVRINEVMRTFTSLSFLTFPFMLIAAIFSMNTRGMPLVDNPNSFWIILSGMAAGMLLLVAYFKNKGWL